MPVTETFRVREVDDTGDALIGHVERAAARAARLDAELVSRADG
jgi:hypothetical protein